MLRWMVNGMAKRSIIKTRSVGCICLYCIFMLYDLYTLRVLEMNEGGLLSHTISPQPRWHAVFSEVDVDVIDN